MKWNETMSKLVKLSGFVADERLERSSLLGMLYFFKDGYVYGSNGVFEFELYCGVDFDGVVSASKFYDIAKVLDLRVSYDVFAVDGNLIISNDGIEVKMNMIETDGHMNRIVDLLSSKREVKKNIEIDWREEIVKILKRVGRIALLGDSSAKYRTICFDRDGIYATDRVRIACYFIPFLVGEERVLLSVDGVKQLVEVMVDERVIGAWIIDGRLYVKFDGEFYVGVLGYDVCYPDLKSILLDYKEKTEKFVVDMVVMDEMRKIVKILDPSDVVYLVVENGWLELKVRSVRGFELERRLQKVDIDKDYMVGVLARDLDGVVDEIVEIGLSDEIIYCRSVEGVEYVVATINT
jgi:hypothetical protein